MKKQIALAELPAWRKAQTFFVLLIASILGEGCQPSLPKEKPFDFTPNETYELTIQKSDPKKGDYWITTLVQDHQHHHRNSQWTIASSPSDQPILDRVADETFINHFLDELPHIQMTTPAPQGVLESFGLSPPHFSVRWKTPKKTYEFYLGLPVKDQSNYYLTLDQKKVWMSQGVALKMLGLLQSFRSLRKKNWSLTGADDADEVEFFQNRKLVFYAQREGDVWTDRKHVRIKRYNIDQFLTWVTQAQIKDFIDRPEEAEKLQKQIHTDPSFEIKLTDRHGKQSIFRLKTIRKIFYGTHSARPHAVSVFDTSSDLIRFGITLATPALRQP